MTQRSKMIHFAWGLCMALLLFSCKKDDDILLFTGDEYQNIMQYISSDEEYSSFTDIVESAKMSDVLSSYNHHVGGAGYTLFLPDNDAVDLFITLSSAYNSLDELLLDSFYSAELVRYHLLNRSVNSNEFPNGVLPDKTISNYYLTVNFSNDEDGEIIYHINDESLVTTADVEKDNGVVHVIDLMLTPIVYTSYEWIALEDGFDIFEELLLRTGLEDTMNYYEADDLGRKTYNEYTLFAESDALYAANGITSFDDLVALISPSDADYSSSSNLLNKYARYHLMTQSFFLDELGTAVYSTYGDLPISVDLDVDLKFNIGTEVYDTIIDGSDTTVIDYLLVDLEQSNKVSKTGAIHQLDQLLFPYLPGLKNIIYEFYEEPVINSIKGIEGTFSFENEDLQFIDIQGSRSISFIKSSTEIEGCNSNDYLYASGAFNLTYTTPKVLAGTYDLRLFIQRGYSYLCNFQVYVDGVKLGSILDPTTGTVRFNGYTIGEVSFSDYKTHEITISSIIPGQLMMDRIMFQTK